MTKFQKIIALCAVEFVLLFACFVISMGAMANRPGTSCDIAGLFAFLAFVSVVVFMIVVFVTYCVTYTAKNEDA